MLIALLLLASLPGTVQGMAGHGAPQPSPQPSLLGAGDPSGNGTTGSGVTFWFAEPARPLDCHNPGLALEPPEAGRTCVSGPSYATNLTDDRYPITFTPTSPTNRPLELGGSVHIVAITTSLPGVLQLAYRFQLEHHDVASGSLPCQADGPLPDSTLTCTADAEFPSRQLPAGGDLRLVIEVVRATDEPSFLIGPQGSRIDLADSHFVGPAPPSPDPRIRGVRPTDLEPYGGFPFFLDTSDFVNSDCHHYPMRLGYVDVPAGTCMPFVDSTDPVEAQKGSWTLTTDGPTHAILWNGTARLHLRIIRFVPQVQPATDRLDHFEAELAGAAGVLGSGSADCVETSCDLWIPTQDHRLEAGANLTVVLRVSNPEKPSLHPVLTDGGDGTFLALGQGQEEMPPSRPPAPASPSQSAPGPAWILLALALAMSALVARARRKP